MATERENALNSNTGTRGSKPDNLAKAKSVKTNIPVPFVKKEGTVKPYEAREELTKKLVWAERYIFDYLKNANRYVKRDEVLESLNHNNINITDGEMRKIKADMVKEKRIPIGSAQGKNGGWFVINSVEDKIRAQRELVLKIFGLIEMVNAIEDASNNWLGIKKDEQLSLFNDEALKEFEKIAGEEE